jgi:thioredoxin 1
MGNYVEVSNNEFDITGEGLKMIAFKADWCQPCKILGPILDELATKNESVVIGKVNIDNNNDITAKYGVRNIPTLLFLRNGEVVDRIVGVKSLTDLQDLVNKYS